MNDFKAHAESTDLEKIEGLLKEGLYIYNTMLVMEADLTDFDGVADRTDIERYNEDDLTEYLKANKLGFGEQDPIETIREELTYDEAEIYISRVGEKLVSSVTIWNIDEDTLACENVFTIPKFRRNYFAANLVILAMEIGKVRGRKKVRLTVYGDDTPAINLYYKLGFKVTKVLQEFRAPGR